jgi:hypothetical protein
MCRAKRKLMAWTWAPQVTGEPRRRECDRPEQVTWMYSTHGLCSCPHCRRQKWYESFERGRLDAKDIDREDFDLLRDAKVLRGREILGSIA